LVLQSFTAEGSTVITTGEHPAVKDQLYDPDYRSDFHWQENAVETCRLLSYLDSGPYSFVFHQVPIGASDEWERFILGVRSLDRRREYSWQVFRDLYPAPFPEEVVTFVKLERDLQEDFYAAVLAEKAFLDQLGPDSFEHKCFYKRICYLLSKSNPARVREALVASSSSSSTSYGAARVSLPPGPSAAPALSVDPRSAFTPILGSQPLALVSFPVDKLVSQVTLESITALWSKLQSHRNQGGNTQRQAVFESRTWECLSLYFGDKWVESVSWTDAKWFQHLLSSIKGDRISEGTTSDDLEWTVLSLVEEGCPLQFRDLREFVNDMDALLAGFQQVEDKLKSAGIREFDQTSWGKVVKKVLNHLRSQGRGAQLPALCERLCSNAQNSLLASKTERNFGSFFKAFAPQLREDHNLLKLLHNKWDVDLSSLAPNAGGAGVRELSTTSLPAQTGGSAARSKGGEGKGGSGKSTRGQQGRPPVTQEHEGGSSSSAPS